MKLNAVDLQLHLKRDSATGSFCEFYEICKNTSFGEHHRTTAYYYSSINNSEGEIGKRNCKLGCRN